MADPITTNPELYHLLFENDRVRVLEYADSPGDRTQPHTHPDSVMVTLSSFSRRLWTDDREVELTLPAFQARWLDAQEHAGMNIGTTATHSIFVELKEPAQGSPVSAALGPQ
jgi:beta-alanine degradation protein BauB